MSTVLYCDRNKEGIVSDEVRFLKIYFEACNVGDIKETVTDDNRTLYSRWSYTVGCN